MKSNILALAAALSPFALLLPLPASGQVLRQDQLSAKVPAAAPAADIEALKADYAEFHSALKVYSEAAFNARQNSRVFLEASASGQYLRARLEGMASRIRQETGAEYRLPAEEDRGPGDVSARVEAELGEVLGFSGPHPFKLLSETIKQGYCQINYVKNNVPFLVQQDGFLKKGEIILTFDDGPGQLTEEVSYSMKEAGAQAVFFVLGAKMGEGGIAHLRKAAADGHEVSVHGYAHATPSGKPFTALSKEETLRQLAGVSASIKAAAGRKPAFFRPPYGIISAEALNAIAADLELTPVGWTIDTLDWSTKDPEELFNKTVSMIKERGRGIVLMHDIHPQSRTAAKRLVKWLGENGYKVVPPERMTKAFRGE